MLIIQIERENFLKENNYPTSKECVVNKETFENYYEDGCNVGYGYNNIEILSNQDFDVEKDRIIRILEKLGCIVDENNCIYFTNEFCENYAKEYFIALKNRICNMTIQEFSTNKAKLELDELEKLLLPLNDVYIYSDSLNAYCTNFMEIVRNRFTPYNKTTQKNVENIAYKIIAIVVAI